MKLIGCVFIATAAIIGSRICLSHLHGQAEDLSGAVDMLSFMQDELENYVCTLPELFDRCGRHCKGKAAAFCKGLSLAMREQYHADFSEKWSGLLERSFNEMKAEDFSALRGLGDILGRYDLETQLAAISAAKKDLEKSYRELNDALPDKRRLWTGCIFLGCAMLMILLI